MGGPHPPFEAASSHVPAMAHTPTSCGKWAWPSLNKTLKPEHSPTARAPTHTPTSKSTAMGLSNDCYPSESTNFPDKVHSKLMAEQRSECS